TARTLPEKRKTAPGRLRGRLFPREQTAKPFDQLVSYGKTSAVDQVLHQHRARARARLRQAGHSGLPLQGRRLAVHAKRFQERHDRYRPDRALVEEMDASID